MLPALTLGLGAAGMANQLMNGPPQFRDPTRAALGDQADRMRQIAASGGAGVAQLNMGLGQALQQQQAAASGARGGPFGQLLAQRNAQRLGGQMQTQANQQAALLRAQQEMAANQELNNLLLQQRQQDMQAYQQKLAGNQAGNQNFANALGGMGELLGALGPML